jgi:UDP-glucose 4-epimerase
VNVATAPTAALVVGGGFLGSHIARGLARDGVQTTVLTRTTPDARARGRLGASRLLVGDASHLHWVQEATAGVDCVVWCAGGLLPAESNQRPIDDVLAQLKPLLVMLDHLAHRKGTRIVLISSGGTVYGDPSVLPVSEDYLPRPLTSHGVTRLAAEQYLGLYQQVFGVSAVALRCGNVYGEGQRSDRSQGVVAATLSRIQRGLAIPMFGDGSTVRDYVYIDDVVDVVIKLLARPNLPSVVNVGSGVGTSLSELLALIEAVTGRPIDIEPHPARPGDVAAVVLDITLLKSLLRFEPTPLREGLLRTWGSISGGEHGQ